MVEPAGALPGEAETSLSDSRAQFVASLGRRLEALREALAGLEQTPRSPELRNHLRRRLHAFGAAAGVLGFDRVFEAFREAEAALGRAGATGLSSQDLALVARTIDLVPSLVLGAGGPLARGQEPAPADRRAGAHPASVLVFGAAPLAEALGAAAGAEALECERTEDASRAEEIVRVMAPDVAVVDADRRGARELIETLVHDPLLDPVKIIAVGTFDRPEAAASLVALGVARVLPKPVGPEALKRSVVEVSRERAVPPPRIDPLGELTLPVLADRLARELQRGLVDAVRAPGRDLPLSLGDGTDVLAALWSSVARIRELLTLRSGGAVRFDATGPEGAVPLAPWMPSERPRGAPGGEARSADGVTLAGRTIVVADDDPAVVWFLSGLLRAAGAEVVEAHDGARALGLVQALWPDLVVSDILMPGMDGFALCREIKRDVALSDVPVILLSWKEDLLQRVRELGADADGYLRKEATASTVVQRVKEALLPRARVELRVASGGDARGRLDGLTPRLVLEIACRAATNATVSFRDAAFLYEVEVRGGRVRAATRTSTDGRSESGERALSALLGVRAGRFAVRPEAGPCNATWDEDLKELVAPTVDRARAAQDVLANMSAVASVELDEGALAPYLAATPQSVAAVARRLAEGASPEAIVATGVPARLVESVLVDAVLHGAVRGVLSRGGNDLLAAAVAAGGARRQAIAVPEAKDFRTPAPAPVAPAAAAPAAAGPAVVTPEPARVSGLAATAAGLVPRRHSSGKMPAVGASSPELPGFPELEPSSELGAVAAVGLDDFLAGTSLPPPEPESRPEPSRIPQKGAAPPTSAPAEPSPLEAALRSLPTPLPSGDAEPAARPAESPKLPDPAPGAAPPRPASSDSSARVAAVVPRPTAREASPAAPPVAPRATAPSPPKPAPTAGAGASPAPSPAAPSRGATHERPILQVVAAEEAEGGAGSRGSDDGVLELSDAVISAIGDEEGSRPASPRADVAAVDDSAAAPRAPQRSTAPGGADQPPGSSPAPAARLPSVIITPPPAAALASTPAEAAEIPLQETPPPVSRTAATLPPVSQVTAPASKRGSTASGPEPKGARPAVPPAEPAAEPEGYLAPFAVVLVAAGAAFAFFRAVIPSSDTDSRPPRADSVAAQSAPSAPGAAPADPGIPVAAATPADTLAVDEAELPSDVAVEAGKGMLELEVPGAAALFVDGVLIGRGPARRVPLAPGQHEVRVQGDGVDVARTLAVHAGRRTRVRMTNTP